MKPCYIVMLFAAALCSVANAQEFKPYPSPRITEAQWSSYYREVKDKHGASMQQLGAERLIVFSDYASQTSYAFTQPGHPAHPAWIARQVVEMQGGVGIRQVGYFAGDEAAFTAMYRVYEDLNDRIGEFMRRDVAAH